MRLDTAYPLQPKITAYVVSVQQRENRALNYLTHLPQTMHSILKSPQHWMNGRLDLPPSAHLPGNNT